MSDLKKVIEKTQYREAELNRAAGEDGRVAISFSSETPVNRGFFHEILSHKPGAIVMDRAAGGLPFLMDHDPKQVVGRAEAIAFTDKGRAMIRFGSSENAVAAKRDIVDDGIRPDISFGYNILEYTEEKRKDGLYITATRWQPMEISSVGVPADIAVGVNRALPKKNPADDESDEDAAEEATESADQEAGEEGDEADNKPKKKRSISAATGRSQEAIVPTPEEIAAAATSAANTQRSVSNEILFLAADHKVPAAQMRAWAEKGFTVEQCKDDILKGIQSGVRAVSQPGAESASADISAEGITGDAKASQEYSWTRAIRAALAMSEGKAPEKSYELEVSNEIAKRLPMTYKQRGSGFYAPMRTRAGLDSVTATKGTELKFTEYGGEVIEILRQTSAAVRLGMRVLSGLTSPVAFPKQLTGVTSYWVPENPGTDVTASNPTWGTVTLNPKTLMNRTAYSRQILNLAVIDVESMVRSEQAISAALAIDKAVFYGLGSAGQPWGIYTSPSVNATAMGSVTPTFGKLVDMTTAIATANAMMGKLGFVTTPGMAGKLMQTLVASAAGSTMIWQGNQLGGSLVGYPAIASNQMSAVMTGSAETGGAEHGVLFGNWNDAIMGNWGVTEIVVDPYTLKNQGMIEVTSFQMTDIILRHGESFTKSTAATLS